MISRITQLPPIPGRPVSGHKGMFGRILVVGGSATMIGAPVLAGTAALRSGAGLVQIATPGAVLATALSITPELIGVARDGEPEAFSQSIESADAIVIGPGMGTDIDSVKLVEKIISVNKSVIVDADALNVLSLLKHWPKHAQAKCILTPHPGEFKRLGHWIDLASLTDDDENRIEYASRLAAACSQVVVLKGHRTVVADASRAYVNRTGDSSLSKAGAGDVLCGILATLVAQEMSLFDAACAAVWIHGRAGELAGKASGRRSALARDVISAIGAAMSEYEDKVGIR